MLANDTNQKFGGNHFLNIFLGAFLPLFDSFSRVCVSVAVSKFIEHISKKKLGVSMVSSKFPRCVCVAVVSGYFRSVGGVSLSVCGITLCGQDQVHLPCQCPSRGSSVWPRCRRGPPLLAGPSEPPQCGPGSRPAQHTHTLRLRGMDPDPDS